MNISGVLHENHDKVKHDPLIRCDISISIDIAYRPV